LSGFNGSLTQLSDIHREKRACRSVRTKPIATGSRDVAFASQPMIFFTDVGRVVQGLHLAFPPEIAEHSIMAFDLKEIVAARLGENYQLHERHVNPTLVAAQRVIGFEKVYARPREPTSTIWTTSRISIF